MWELLKKQPILVAVIGVFALAGFVLPTPAWVAWPSLIIAGAAIARLMVVGNRRYQELHDQLDLDHIDNNVSRVNELTDILNGRDRKH